MKPISYIICAAGKGLRFRDFGINRPKPTIKLNGKTMLERSLESLQLRSNDQLIIIAQKADQLPHFFPKIKCEWIEIDFQTSGQLDTFLLSKDIIQYENIVIYNCDTYFNSLNLLKMIDSDMYDGIIPCSSQPGISWSFCDINEDESVRRVTEKERISPWASVGYYYFKNKDRLISFAQLESLERSLTESYVAPIYNRYIAMNLKIQMAQVETFLPFGSIEQVKDYWNVSIEELLLQNK